jgi:hypothetical protein
MHLFASRRALSAVLMLLSAVAAPAADIFYEDWEGKASPLENWQLDTQAAAVQLAVNGGVWQTYHVTFNSGAFSKAAIYLGAYASPSGRCWFDHLVPQGFTLQNPSFEELDANGMPVGWGADSPGKWVHVSDKAADGARSVMFFDAAYAAEMIRVSQIVEVKPNTDYSYSFDFYMENDFYGGIRCSVIAADAPEYYLMGYMVEDIDPVIADRSAAGSRQCRMTLTDGAAALSRPFAVPAGAVLEARASCRIKALTGTLNLVVADQVTGNELARAQAAAGIDGWQQISARFVAPPGAVTVRVAATGKGEALVDGIGISAPRLLPPVQSVKWAGAAAGFTLPKSLTYQVKGGTSSRLETGLGILAKDLARAGVKLAESADKPALVMVIGKAPHALRNKGDEAYSLAVSKNGVRLEAQTERGAFYGLMTLTQLLYVPAAGRPSLVASKIADWPDLPWRSLFNAREPEWMARRKFNRAEHPDITRYAEYQKYNIIAIPHDNITHYPYRFDKLPALLQDPNYAEGIGQVDTLALVGEAPANLSGLNVLRTKLTDIEVTSADGAVRYQEGQDYRVIPGDLELEQTTRFKPNGKPFAIARLPGGKITDGQTVLARYEHAGINSSELCLAEEEPQRVVAERARDVVATYNLPYFAAHDSEAPEGIGKGPRCVATGRTPAQLWIRYYERVDKAAKSANPACRLLIWTDDLLPWQNAPRTKLAAAAVLLPADAIMGNWYYGPGGTVQVDVKTAELWTQIGRDFTLMGWYDSYNIRCTAAVALWARQRGMPCLGTSSWAYPPGMGQSGFLGFLDEVATCAWRGPRKGEPGYIDVAAELAKGSEKP